MNINEITICEIKDVMTVFSPKGRSAKIHNRSCYGLSFCEEGQITYVHNGKSFISDNNHLIILPQGQSYTLHGDKTGVFPLINFTCTEKIADTFLLFPISNMTSLMNDFLTLRELFLFPENRAKLMSVFYNMLHTLSLGTAICKTIAPAIDFIEKNYKNSNLTNEKIAAACNISEVYLRKLFMKHLNATPKQYISEIRLQKAKQLLTEGVLKINAVAETCGFSNQYHFSRFFKQNTGMTPTEFMTQYRTVKL